MNEQQIWQFSYHRGQAHLTGYVRELNEDRAYRKAVLWCERENHRPPSAVRPWLVGEDIVIPPDILSADTVTAVTLAGEPISDEVLQKALASFQ